MTMNIIAVTALLVWIPFVLILFMLLPARRAVIVSFIVAWLFLPMGGFHFDGLPSYTKMSATCIGVLMGVAIFDSNRLGLFRFSAIDIPVVIWCLVPFASSIANGLGVYDGASGVVNRIVIWGAPYLIGRLYLYNLAGLRELAIGVFVGGLVYIPLCLYEIRMSPQLHIMLYGYLPHGWSGTRFGGWRPTVFMQNGLALGLWMTSASLVGIWLWMSGSLRTLLSIPIVWLAMALVITTLLCKSFGALLLLAIGLTGLFLTRWLRISLPVLSLILAAPCYMIVRSLGIWSGEPVPAIVEEYVSVTHAGSLQMRLDNEDLLIERALQRPFLGWGGWGRSRVTNDYGEDISITDGLWVIVLGTDGIVGLASLTFLLLLPPLMLLRTIPARYWSTPRAGGAVALAMLLIMFMFDSLLNAMLNPIYIVAVGGLSGFCLAMRSSPRVLSER